MSAEKIKILFRHRSMEMGGVEKVLLSLLNNLDRNKFEIAMLLNLNQGELRNEIPPHVKKIWIAEGKEDFSKNKLILKSQQILRRLKLEFLKIFPTLTDTFYLKSKYDIEIAMDWRDYNSVLGSTSKNSKKIAWFHSEINHPKFEKLVPQVIRQFPQFDQIIYCSQKIKELMHQQYPRLSYPNENVVINAVPIAEIKKKAEEKINDLPPSPLFVSVGRLHTRKGYHKLMNVHAKLLKDGFQHYVMIIGHGEELPNLSAQQKLLGVEKTFIFAGNKMNPYPYIRNADFFIMPSESEAWPLVIAEALILQKPIIATEVGDVGLMIRHNKTGYLVDYNEDEMYAAMKEFLTNPVLIEEVKHNLLSIEKEFDNQKIVDDVEEILINLAK